MTRTHYARGERVTARRFGGLVFALSRTEYVLVGFDIGAATLKPQHERFLNELVDRFGLLVSSAGARVESILGYTDAVDTTDAGGNQRLRGLRANAVAQALVRRGVPSGAIGTAGGAPMTAFLVPNTSVEGRVANRGVYVRISEVSGRPLHRVPLPDFDPPGRPGCTRWALQGVAGLSAGRGVGCTAQGFILHNLCSGEQRTVTFQGVGFVGAIPLPRIPRIPRLPRGLDIPARPGFSAPGADGRPSLAHFHTSRPVWFEDFDLLVGAFFSVALEGVAGSVSLSAIGFATAWRDFTITADDGTFGGTPWLDVGGLSVGGAGIGPTANAVPGVLTSW